MDLRTLFNPSLKSLQKDTGSLFSKRQLELPIDRPLQPDRNFRYGGRSFYFFDFDDNVAFLSTRIYVFEKDTGREVALTTGEFANISKTIGKSGPFGGFELNYDEQVGSFRRFRDQNRKLIDRFLGRPQPFIEDLAEALGFVDLEWKGPSWETFFHATINRRPVSVITARGHSVQTIKDGIRVLVNRRHIPHEPNYLGIYPVSNTAVRDALGDTEKKMSIAALKQRAIRQSVEEALRVYGSSPHHRFGMSDDDPHNIELIVEEMTRLKKDYPDMSFFVIETHREQYLKSEVLSDRIITQPIVGAAQLSFFESRNS